LKLKTIQLLQLLNDYQNTLILFALDSTSSSKPIFPKNGVPIGPVLTATFPSNLPFTFTFFLNMLNLKFIFRYYLDNEKVMVLQNFIKIKIQFNNQKK